MSALSLIYAALFYAATALLVAALPKIPTTRYARAAEIPPAPPTTGVGMRVARGDVLRACFVQQVDGSWLGSAALLLVLLLYGYFQERFG
jgi:hypothetical protein